MKQVVLCVDDEAVILLALKLKLKKALGNSCLVESAYNGKQALEILRELSDSDSEVKLVITDWLMPGMRGDELLRIIKKDFPSVRGIMITGQADRDSIEAVIREGLVEGVFGKPWSEKQLLNAVRKCLE
ncbi:MAG: response regulator [Spirochaetales bacterium]|nr:response regulator [Spirochaetales bacterium]